MCINNVKGVKCKIRYLSCSSEERIASCLDDKRRKVKRILLETVISK